MSKKFMVGLCVVVIAGAFGPIGAMAQNTTADELSSSELEALFAKQKTRGLVIAPSGDEQDDAETVGVTGSAPAAGQSYQELAPEEQVNVSISFDFDSSVLRDDQKPKLATLCEVMQTVDVNLFRIVGHTDKSGPASYNESLSLLRAQEVKRHLVAECSIDESRLDAVGVGESYPLDKDDPHADVNRRVEFQALS